METSDVVARLSALIVTGIAGCPSKAGVIIVSLLVATFALFRTERSGTGRRRGRKTASVATTDGKRVIGVPGDTIVGYLGRGEGLVVHTDNCGVAQRLKHKDSERFIAVDWADEPVRMFETGIVVTITNSKGVLARVAADLASAEADITHVDMDDEVALDTTDLRFIVAVRDQAHLEAALRNLRRTQAVLRASRITPQAT